MNTKKIYYILLTVLIFITVLRSQAAMTFLVDTSAKEFSFVGTLELDVTDTRFHISSISGISLPSGDSRTPMNGLFTLSNDVSWDGDFGFFAPLDFIVGSFRNVTIGNSVIVTGTGTTVSYAAWPPEAIAFIDNFATSGGTLNIIDASTSDDITTTAVPEPRGYAALMALGTVACLCYLRRRRCS